MDVEEDVTCKICNQKILGSQEVVVDTDNIPIGHAMCIIGEIGEPRDPSEPDVTDIMEKFEEVHRIYRYEGSSGVRNLLTLTQALDPENYRDFEDFLEDNPGACETIVGWITETMEGLQHWQANLLRDIEENTQSEEVQNEPIAPECSCHDS